MKYFIMAIVLFSVLAATAVYDEIKTRKMEQEIECLKVRVDALQVSASPGYDVPEFDGIPVKRPKVLKH